MIADRYAMGIAAEIAQHRRGPTEGWLRIDDPVGIEEPSDKGAPTRGVAEWSSQDLVDTFSTRLMSRFELLRTHAAEMAVTAR